ncbi:glycoside hydrolase family 43 protein [Pontibacter sp. 172403-2]|uniref:glycoside hydrolase family 43 protein n=1 Tax=Pontibacter rufus TaxID=2791028 RepID=UPI0018AFD592|nr:glycoside hydrolase family 43 protein [Pontibacter sp. 172403-2]MBF9252864.1 glycoside hydrolase family 43 protein [Pontibacter sp. 172403-2]
MKIKIYTCKSSAASVSILTLFILWLTACPVIAQTQATDAGSRIALADPTIFYNKGTYYLYGTVGSGADEGFLVYTSGDMKTWEGPKGVKDGFALKKGDVFGDKGFWAPQVFKYKNKFYMAYTANEHIAIAQSDSPLGPFTQNIKEPLAAPVKQIDPFVFIDDDGKKYLYHVRLTDGNRVFVAEMTDEFSAIKSETLKEVLSAKEPWENTANAEWPVSEGPSILKHKGLYYLVYSANDFRNPDYAVGYAVSKSPMGPWQKYKGNPVLSRKDIGVNGTGHGDFVRDGNGDLYYVFHTHQSNTTVGPRVTAIVKAHFAKDKASGTDKLVIEKNSFYYPVLAND